MPTALAPASCASCPTSDPTGPLAAATTTVSPGCGLPITRRPPYAVNPGIPSTPRPVVTGAAAGSSLRRPVPFESACVRHPVRARTTSPLTYAGLFETSTCATVSPVITSPISSGLAYDLPSFIRPRMYDGKDRKSTRLNSSHLVISYAVFCLKKKKNTHTYPRARLLGSEDQATDRS